MNASNNTAASDDHQTTSTSTSTSTSSGIGLATNSSSPPIQLSTPVRLLLRICEWGSVFFAAFALMYIALLEAPVGYLSDKNWLKNSIKKEQSMKHVDVNIVIYWMIVDVVCVFVTRQILSVNQFHYPSSSSSEEQ